MKNWRNHIESNPEVMYGKPVIKNTRIPVDLLLEKLSEGETMEELLYCIDTRAEARGTFSGRKPAQLNNQLNTKKTSPKR